MSYSGASVRLCFGRLSISTDDVHFPPEFEYGENEDFLKYFVLSYIKLLSDSPLRFSSEKPVKLYAAFFRRLCTTRLSDTIKTFSGYSHQILSNEYSTGGDSSTRVFHEFMKDTPIFKEYLEWIRTRQPELLKYILTFLLFGKKLDYVDESFNTTAFRGWLEVEDKLRTLTFAEIDVANLRNIIKAILGPFQPDALLPRFGPGKVAERGIESVYDKLVNLSLHPRLSYAFNRERPGCSREEGFGDLHVIKQAKETSGHVSRLKFVPKDITKSRSICMEPNAFMYFQQEVLRWLSSSMSRGLISRFVNMKDQSLSQMAAVHGSIYLSTDTIDLSSASDSVSVELVRQVFPADILFYLLATRTSLVEVPDSKVAVKVNKFAPMGSAVCFPVQCIIFASVCIYSAMAESFGEATGLRTFSVSDVTQFVKTKFHRERSEHTPFTKKYEPPVVYGDDIAIDSRSTDNVISTLTRLGFSVNVGKSFTGSQSFRESCGVFAFEGHDVTPVLFRLPFFKVGRFDAKVYSSFIGAINWFRTNRLYGCATFFTITLDRYGFKYPLPYCDNSEDFGIHVSVKRRPNSKHLRWNADWQTNEEVIQGIGPRFSKEKVPPNLEEYRKDQWWRSRVSGDTTLVFTRGLHIRPQETRLVPIWTRYE